MTRDSFLPSGAGALDDTRLSMSGSGESSSSVISPLSLPRGASNYFDAHTTTSHTAGPVNGSNSSGSGGGHYNTTSGNGRNSRGVYSPLSPSTRAVTGASPPAPTDPKPQPHEYLSPRLLPTSTQLHHQLQQQQRRQQLQQRQQQQQQRSASLSPTRRSASLGAGSASRTRSAIASPTNRVPLPSNAFMPLTAATMSGHTGPTSHPASAPAAQFAGGSGLRSPLLQSQQPNLSAPDLTLGSNAATMVSIQAQKIAWLEKQNTLIKQSWENERRHLEANRARAEEVYLEDRALMDFDRNTWEADRASLVDRIRQLEDQVRALAMKGGPSGGRYLHMSSGAVGSIPEEETGTPGGAAGAGVAFGTSQPPTTHATPAFQSKPFPPQQPLQQGASSGSLSAASTRLASLAPSKQTESSPFIPLPQHQPQQPAHTDPSQPTSSGEDSGADMTHSEAVPVIDVQTLHPDLEGIPIKKRAIQKHTFTAQNAANPTFSFGGDKPSSATSLSPKDFEKTSPPRLHSPGEETLKVLAAPETARLTMHAGHTPNHSLSVLPTMLSTAAPTTASSSGDVTPTTTTTGPSDALGSDGALATGSSSSAVEPIEPPVTKMATNDPATAAAPVEDEEVIDRPLRGPLMIRNQPAHDEIFLRRLSEKLEDVKNGEDAVPTVLKSEPLASESSVAGDGADENKPRQGRKSPPKKGDRSSSSHSPGGDDDTTASSGGKDVLDIPLRIRKTSNFGAPLGEMKGGHAHAH